MGFTMTMLDLGGGFSKGLTESFVAVTNAINAALDQHFPVGCGVRIIAEPGRYFAEGASALGVVVNGVREQLRLAVGTCVCGVCVWGSRMCGSRMCGCSMCGFMSCWFVCMWLYGCPLFASIWLVMMFFLYLLCFFHLLPGEDRRTHTPPLYIRMHLSPYTSPHASPAPPPCAGGAPTSPPIPHVDYFVSDGIYGSFNCILYDHPTLDPHVLHMHPPSDNSDPGATAPGTVFGPTCDGMDKILEHVQLPAMQPGDWLLFPNMGAYTIAGACNFNGFDAMGARRFYVYPVGGAPGGL